MASISNYFSLIKFSHTIFALPFAVIGFFLAVTQMQTPINWMLFLYVLLCMVFARSAAMAFNRYIDRDIDKANARTAKVREIPNGSIQPKSALVFVIINCVLFIATTYFINPLCFYLSPVALLVVLGYSLTKRFTALCHLVLGVGLSLAPIGAYLAVTGKFDWLPLFFSFAVLFWVSGFDIIYALQDEEFDKQQQLHSIPVVLGKKNALFLSTILHIVTASLILFAGFYGSLNLFYWIGSGIFIALLFYQHTIVKPNDLSKVNFAFFTTNGIASVVFSIFVLLDLFLS
ncbi:MAG: 4-hydroxybenzoate octaprenyltransferase [Flavobacteriales bacterium]|nr:4-hydroxybenzoate octaprenyltransferase [Flavobacteriales bacterium]